MSGMTKIIDTRRIHTQLENVAKVLVETGIADSSRNGFDCYMFTKDALIKAEAGRGTYRRFFGGYRCEVEVEIGMTDVSTDGNIITMNAVVENVKIVPSKLETRDVSFAEQQANEAIRKTTFKKVLES